MSAAGGNLHLLAALGVTALRSVTHLPAYWSLQRRHPDGERWLDLAHYATHADALEAHERVLEHGHAQRHELRVTHITRQAS